MKGVYSSRHPAHGGCISRSSSFVYSPWFFLLLLWASSLAIPCSHSVWNLPSKLKRSALGRQLYWYWKTGEFKPIRDQCMGCYCYCYHYWTWTIVVTLTRLSFPQNPCSSSPCLNNGTCQAGFTRKGFRCRCHKGFIGSFCDRIGMAQSHEPTTLLVPIVKFFL